MNGGMGGEWTGRWAELGDSRQSKIYYKSSDVSKRYALIL